MKDEKFKINLQLFAEDEKETVDDTEVEDIDTEEDEEVIDDEPAEEEESEEEPVKPGQDKVTKALIKQKKENKELRQKLLQFEQTQKEQELKEKKKQLIDKYLDKGYDEDEAIKMADNNTKLERLETELERLRYERQAEKLEKKYPDIWDDFNRLVSLCKKTEWSLEKVCQAEYGNVDAYDVKVKTEQEALIKRQKANQAKPVTSDATPLKAVTLSPEDEKAFQFYKQRNPGVTRKQYKETIIDRASQKIPHDRWED